MRMQSLLLRFTAVAAVTLLAVGCNKKASSPTDSGGSPIGETNLFPLAAGHTVVYSEYALDTTSSQRVDATVHRHVTTVGAAVMHNGKNAFPVVDSVYTPAGDVASVGTTYMAVDGGDLYVEFDNAWAVLFKRSAGVGTSYFVRTYTDSSTGFKVSVDVSGLVMDKESVQTGAGTFQAYKLQLKGVVTGFGIEFPVYFYFADGVGPIKETTPVGSNPLTGTKIPGDEMVMVSKNF